MLVMQSMSNQKSHEDVETVGRQVTIEHGTNESFELNISQKNYSDFDKLSDRAKTLLAQAPMNVQPGPSPKQ